MVRSAALGYHHRDRGVGDAKTPVPWAEGMDMSVTEITDDLVAEQRSLDTVVAELDDEQWSLDTPSPGWTVTDQIGHLAFFDGTATLAIADPDGFVTHRNDLIGRLGDAGAVDEIALGPFRELTPSERLAEWRRRRDELETAARGLADDTRIEWYGPSMGAKSFLTARLMEAWAHGQDVCDTVGAAREPTDRLRHIAQLGVITRGWTYASRGLEQPVDDVRVELTAPSGTVWTWGPADAPATIRGPALDFCLVVTQRRHRDDTALALTGHAATDWMSKAQAFAGPPTDGPSARAAG